MTQRPFHPLLVLSLTPGSALAFPVMAQTPLRSGTARYFEGEAHASDNGKLAYTEAHWTYDGDSTRSELVLYECPDGKAFARKLAHENGSAQAPDFKLEDARSGYQQGVRDQDGRRVIFVREKRGAKERTAVLEATPVPVIDGGFDAYVRQHWDDMQPQDKATFHFVVPSRLETMKFTLKRETDEPVDGHPARVYRLSPDSLLSFALPHIHVTYDAKSRQLSRFDGLTNIHGSGHRNLRARITFDPAQSRQVSQTDVQAALRRPLDGRCSFPRGTYEHAGTGVSDSAANQRPATARRLSWPPPRSPID